MNILNVQDIVESYREYIARKNKLTDIEPFEDYSDTLKVSNSNKYKCKIYEYVGCSNNNIIVEGSFSRCIDTLQNQAFAIITAYRNEFTKEENIIRNRILRGVLNAYKMGVIQLVGHWRESPNGIDYDVAKPSELIDCVERSYVVPKPQDMSFEDFKKFIVECLTIENKTQDCGLIHDVNGFYYELRPNGQMKKIGEKLTLNKIAQAYSQYVKKLDVPFVFEGIECPSSNSGCLIFKENNINYYR